MSKCFFLTFAYQFEGTEIALDSRMGIFVTMNPGYAGRTELPESVKALFRPVMCIVPDLQQICEIMLFSEGFLLAKVTYFANCFLKLVSCFDTCQNKVSADQYHVTIPRLRIRAHRAHMVF